MSLKKSCPSCFFFSSHGLLHKYGPRLMTTQMPSVFCSRVSELPLVLGTILPFMDLLPLREARYIITWKAGPTGWSSHPLTGRKRSDPSRWGWSPGVGCETLRLGYCTMSKGWGLSHLLPTPHSGKVQIVKADHEAHLPFGKSWPCTLTFVWVRQWYPKGAERQWASECRQAELEWANVSQKALGEVSKKWIQR